MKLVCKSCKYEQIVQDKSLTQCPRCGSNDIKIFLFGSTRSTGKGKIFGTSFWCGCLCELLIPLILFLILFLAILHS